MKVFAIGDGIAASLPDLPSSCRLRTALSLDDARSLVAAEAVPADMVLAQLALPDSQGLETFTAVRGLLPAVPVVVLVGADEADLGLACVEAGAEEFVVQGALAPETLCHLVKSAAARGRRETALIQAKEQAEEATRLKDKFVSLVAHDLRGPLGALLGLLQMMLMRKDVPLPEVHRTSLQFIIDNGHNLQKVIEDLLNLSRLKTGKIVPELRLVDGHFTAEIAIQKVSLVASQKSLTIHNDVPEGARFYVDPALFGQVVQNLLSNAIKFSQPGKSIDVFTEERDGMALLGIRDRGVGIPEAIVPKLFRLEEKTSTPGTAGEQGTGFGLPLSNNLMEAMQGSLLVESREGEGSIFYAAVPFVKPRVLAVDDDPLYLGIHSRRLRALGVEVATAENGRQALEAIAAGELPHLVLADLQMPVMDGFQLLRALKDDPRTGKIPVIVVTGDAEIATRREALGLGADDFIVKPSADAEFLPRVRRFIG